MTIKEAINQSYQNAKEHGFWDNAKIIDRKVIQEKLLLMHAEISEAFEEVRAGHTDPAEIYYGNGAKPEGFGIELADLAIRLFDLCGAMMIPLEHLIEVKHEYNVSRPKMHGKEC